MPCAEVFAEKCATEFASIPASSWLFAVSTFPALSVYAFAAHNTDGGMNFVVSANIDTTIHFTPPLLSFS